MVQFAVAALYGRRKSLKANTLYRKQPQWPGSESFYSGRGSALRPEILNSPPLTETKVYYLLQPDISCRACRTDRRE